MAFLGNGYDSKDRLLFVYNGDYTGGCREVTFSAVQKINLRATHQHRMRWLARQSPRLGAAICWIIPNPWTDRKVKSWESKPVAKTAKRAI
jgi:hypothetical protein